MRKVGDNMEEYTREERMIICNFIRNFVIPKSYECNHCILRNNEKCFFAYDCIKNNYIYFREKLIDK